MKIKSKNQNTKSKDASRKIASKQTNHLTIEQIRAVCYADVFDYPLTKKEVVRFEILNLKSKANSKLKAQSSKQIVYKNGYFFLEGREEIVGIRKTRNKYSKEKYKIAEKTASLLKRIPSVTAVAVTGALAMNNVDENDDIDLLIITKTGKIWTTRFIVILLLDSLGLRRKPNDVDFTDKICVNMFVDEDHLAVPKKERDLFSAHEVAQIRCLWSRGDIVSRFVKENVWIRSYLPNITFSSSQLPTFGYKSQITLRAKIVLLVGRIVSVLPLEKLLRHVQLSYMKKRRTKEVIREGYLRFHPKDARGWVMREYRNRVKKMPLAIYQV